MLEPSEVALPASMKDFPGYSDGLTYRHNYGYSDEWLSFCVLRAHEKNVVHPPMYPSAGGAQVSSPSAITFKVTSSPIVSAVAASTVFGPVALPTHPIRPIYSQVEQFGATSVPSLTVQTTSAPLLTTHKTFSGRAPQAPWPNRPPGGFYQAPLTIPLSSNPRDAADSIQKPTPMGASVAEYLRAAATSTTSDCSHVSAPFRCPVGPRCIRFYWTVQRLGSFAGVQLVCRIELNTSSLGGELNKTWLIYAFRGRRRCAADRPRGDNSSDEWHPARLPRPACVPLRFHAGYGIHQNAWSRARPPQTRLLSRRAAPGPEADGSLRPLHSGLVANR